MMRSRIIFCMRHGSIKCYRFFHRSSTFWHAYETHFQVINSYCNVLTFSKNEKSTDSTKQKTDMNTFKCVLTKQCKGMINISPWICDVYWKKMYIFRKWT
jgi:hypothetical protein